MIRCKNNQKYCLDKKCEILKSKTNQDRKIKYMVVYDNIKKIEIIRETECCVYMENGARRAKKSANFRFCDTWEKAKNVLCYRAFIRALNHGKKFHKAKEKYEKFKRLQEKDII